MIKIVLALIEFTSLIDYKTILRLKMIQNNVHPLLESKSLNFKRAEVQNDQNMLVDSSSHNDLHFYDDFMKKTINKLEATESKKNYLHRQTRLIKNSLLKLSDKLCDDDEMQTQRPHPRASLDMCDYLNE